LLDINIEKGMYMYMKNNSMLEMYWYCFNGD